MRKCLLLLVLVAIATGCTCTTPTSYTGSSRDDYQDPVDDWWTIDPYLGEKMLLYPVNRVLDVLDLISINVGVGADLQPNVHVTRALQLGAGGAVTGRLGFNRSRQVGFYTQEGYEISFLPMTNESYKRANGASWGSMVEVESKINGTSAPGRKIYNEARDYWAIGGHVPLLLASVEADVHIAEIPDLVLGFLGVDLMRDDLNVKSGTDPLE